jgi:glycerate 2-kinase
MAFVAGGETTVTVHGQGIGGRNHELALAAALELSGRRPCAILAAGTDGIDGLTAAAGAVVDPTTLARMRAAGVDAVAALEDNDSGQALAAAGDAIRTGPTGTNVCDVVLALSA